MARDFSEVLQQAMEFYVAGQLVEARALLLDIVRADPRSEAGWMFLSYTLEEPAQKADCLRKVLALDPENSEAKAALEKLHATFGTGPVEAVPAPITAEPSSPQPAPAPVPPPAAPPIEPSPSDAPTIVHASPFTVDIDHANDDISVIPEVGVSGLTGQATPPSKPFITSKLQQPAALAQKQGAASAAPAEPIRKIDQPAPPAGQVAAVPVRNTGELAQSGVPVAAATVRKTGQLAQPGGQVAAVPVRRTGQLAQPGGQAAGATVRKTGQLAQPGAQPAEKPAAKKKRGSGCTCLIVGAVLVLIAAGIGAGLWMTGNLPALSTGGVNTAPTDSPVPADTPTPFVLPPRATNTPTPTITLTSTITPTQTATFTPTKIAPDATLQVEIGKIEQQVSDLRGLKLSEPLPIYLVTQNQAEELLQAELASSGLKDAVENDSIALIALGFISPSYDIQKHALGRLSDGYLGWYQPKPKSIYIIGFLFRGRERVTFAHEYGHALVHTISPVIELAWNDPMCVNDSQRCDAIDALMEGDATLVSSQWYDQYATDADKRDLEAAPTAYFVRPADNPPPYVDPYVHFPYLDGGNFVYSFFKIGSWARVNKIYDNLPVSTEQILHPQKYLDGEGPVAMKIPDLAKVLGQNWSLVKSDSLGEYMTYLLLAYGEDLAAQIDTNTAITAAAGWGGDHYLVFSSPDSEGQVLAAEWAWDTDADAAQFYSAVREYVDKRFRGEITTSSSGLCWARNQETTCLFRSGKEILWVLAPDLDIITRIRSAYGKY